MPDITNSDLITELIKGAGLQAGIGKIPRKISDIVIPTLEVNPRLLRFCNISASANSTASGTSLTILSIPAGYKFYCVEAFMRILKDATNDAADHISALRATIEGQTLRTILAIPTLTTTAQDAGLTTSLNPPLVIDAGTSITLSHATFTVGKYTKIAGVIGYLVQERT